MPKGEDLVFDKGPLKRHCWAVSLTVLLVAHGTVDRLEDLPAFVQKIRRGRPAPPELIEELRRRYLAVDGSPLLKDSLALARGLHELLGLEVRVAMRLWEPYVEDVLSDLSPDDEVLLVPLAPFSVAVYLEAAKETLAARGLKPKLRAVPAYGDHPMLVEAWASAVRQALSAGEGSVLLSAHSLPRAVIDRGDPYAREFERAAARVGAALAHEVRVVYQSQGAMDGAWLGPSVDETLRELSRAGERRVILSPIGFLSEHVETRYDLDREAQALAGELGLELIRVPTVHADGRLLPVLHQVIQEAL